jgi:hypothetical protein
MQVVGRFKELERSAEGPSIFDAKETLDAQTAMIVAAYLESGVSAFDVMESVRDPFDSSVSIPGGSSLLSDGDWVWRADLAHFVRAYRVALPDAFVRRALSARCVSTPAPDVLAKLDDILAAAGWK